jgi:hypothetical protein
MVSIELNSNARESASRMTGKMIATAWSVLCFCFCLSASAAEEPEVHLEGWGFTIETIDNGTTSFGNRTYVFRNVPELIRGWNYARLHGGENLAAYSATPDRNGYLHVVTASGLPGTDMLGWEEIESGDFHYTDGGSTALQLFRKQVEAGESVPVPQGNWTGGMVVAPGLTGQAREPERDDSTVPGTVVAHRRQATGIFIGSPGLAVLDEGVYLAKYDAFGPGSTEGQSAVTHFFRSEDFGVTWKEIYAIQGLFWASVFVHEGAVYVLGTDRLYGNTVIYRSDDGGFSWTAPTDASDGLLYSGLYHTAPMPVVIHNGRIWRAMETADNGTTWGKRFGAFMMSAPVGADLLKGGSWVRSNVLYRDASWLNGEFGGWLEGNAVVDRGGKILTILRVDRFRGETAAVVRVSDDGETATFDSAKDFINFPGGATKFTIRYDDRSDLYWALANYVPPIHRGRNAAATRNTLALVSSSDLRKWEVRSILIYHPDVSKHGFQYVDWHFEGNDIIALSRTANDDGLGGARNYHDANYLTFHRFSGFRELSMGDSVVNPEELGISDSELNEQAGHWRFDETEEGSAVVNSAPGEPVSGVRIGAVEIGQAGIAGGAYRFAGGARVDTRRSDWVPGTSDFSLFAWVLTTSSHSTQGHVVSNNAGSAIGRSNLTVIDGKAMYFLGGGPNLLLMGETRVDDGKWHHLGVTRAGDVFTLWVNGRAEASANSTTTVGQQTSWVIGSRPGGGFPFDGLIDDVGVWREKALPPEEISVIGGLGRIGFSLSARDDRAAIGLMFETGGGAVRTGNWKWRRTTDFPLAADGSVPGRGKPYEGVDGAVYVILSGTEGAWEGVLAEKVEPWTYARWVATHFAGEGAEDPEVVGPLATPAGDTVVNLLKYAFGLAPEEPATIGALIDLDRPTEGLVVSFARLKEASDLTYVVEVSSDLRVWAFGPEVTETIRVEDRGEVEQVVVRATSMAASSPMVFVRVRVVLVN